jgi:hypothetical protein
MLPEAGLSGLILSGCDAFAMLVGLACVLQGLLGEFVGGEVVVLGMGVCGPGMGLCGDVMEFGGAVVNGLRHGR